jgi:hypothetical protein
VRHACASRAAWLSRAASAATPVVGRRASRAERERAFFLWAELAAAGQRRDDARAWTANVTRQAIESGTFHLELDQPTDLDRVVAIMADLSDQLETRLTDLPAADRGRGHHALACYYRTLVEMSLVEDRAGTLRTAAGAAEAALGDVLTDLSAEVLARRHHTLSVIARQIARTDDPTWWDTAVDHSRAAVGLMPGGGDVPEPAVAPPPPVRRWNSASGGRGSRSAIAIAASCMHRPPICATHLRTTHENLGCGASGADQRHLQDILTYATSAD